MTQARRPKLGQHFLISETYRRRVADALPLRSDEVVLEIGPGRGAMTRLLLDRARQVVAVEIDSDLAGCLRTQFTGEGRLEVLNANILDVDLTAICRRYNVDRIFAFGNLPYYIASPIIHRLLDSASRLQGMAFVVQREVAERIATSPGSRAYGYLSVLAQAYSTPRIAFNIPPGAFQPPPAVQSALIMFKTPGVLAGLSDQQARDFLEFAKLGFSQKRKKLANNLAAGHGTDKVRAALHSCGLDEASRAEQLSVRDLWRIFRHLTRSPDTTAS